MSGRGRGMNNAPAWMTRMGGDAGRPEDHDAFGRLARDAPGEMANEGGRLSQDIPPQVPLNESRGAAAHVDDTSVLTYDTSFSRDSYRSRGYPIKNRERRRDDTDNNRNRSSFRRSSSRSGSRSRSRSRSPGGSRYVESNGPRGRDRSEGWRDRDDEGHNGYNAPSQSQSNGQGSFERRKGRDQRRERSTSRSQDRRSDFGFSRGKFHPMSKSKSLGRALGQQENREWPPCFDTDGSDFVFDTRSAMFYEALSNFFYDPKSKLYYGNKKLAYFRYDETQDPPFVEVHKTTPEESTQNPTESQTNGINNENNNNEAIDAMTMPAPQSSTLKTIPTAKPVIAINLKTKKIKKPKAAVIVKPAPMSKAQTEQAANIAKWAEKKAELKADIKREAAEAAAKTQSFTPRPEPVAVAVSDNTPPSDPPKIGTAITVSNDAGPTIRKTVKGEPICVVCKRKFPTIEKLRLHERVSDLHRQNLEKLATNNGKRKEASSPLNYQDRARKRRELHGPESTKPERKGIDASRGARGPDISQHKRLGSDNIGNQMLKKLGWQSGTSVGRRFGESSGSGENCKLGQPNYQGLRKDWEMIESAANKGARGPPST